MPFALGGPKALLRTCFSVAVCGVMHNASKVSDVVDALTFILQASRLASRTDPKLNKEGTDGRVLADLIALISFGQFTELVNSVSRMSLDECDPATLKTFLREARHSRMCSQRCCFPVICMPTS